MDRRIVTPRGFASFSVSDCCNPKPRIKNVATQKLLTLLRPEKVEKCSGDTWDGMEKMDLPEDLKGRGRIVDLCPEDRERVVNLIEELEKHVEVNKSMRERSSELEAESSTLVVRNASLAKELSELKVSSDAAAERLKDLERELRESSSASSKAVEAKERLERRVRELEAASALEAEKCAQACAALASERSAFSAELDLLAAAKEKLRKSLEESRLRNDAYKIDLCKANKVKGTLQKEKQTVLAQVSVLRSKLNDVSKDSKVFKNKLGQVQKDIAMQSKKAPLSVDQSVQTSSPPPCACKSVAPGRPALNGEESQILKDLFFTGGDAHSMPPEIEDIFFPPHPLRRPPPTDNVLDTFTW